MALTHDILCETVTEAEMAIEIEDFYRGDTKRYKAFFEKNTGTEETPVWAPVDITGWKLYFTMKLDAESADVDAALQVVFTAGDDAGGPDYPDVPTGGVMYLILTSDDTEVLTSDETYEYDFQRVIPGVVPDVKTIQRGKVKVLTDVSITDA
jgi:hypothetical protein